MRCLMCRLLLVAAAAAAMASAVPSCDAQALPPAYLPLLSTQSIIPAAPSGGVAAGYLRLTPKGCSGASCSGFQQSSSADFSKQTNSAVFTPAQKPVMVEPMGTGTYEIGTINLTNGGLLQPTGAKMALVPLKAAVMVSTPGVNKPTNLALNLQVMWSLGSPAPPNQAGLFVLVMNNPVPSYDFKLAMTPQIDFPMNLRVVGFKADASAQGSGLQVLGDWGKPAPAAGEPGPRVYVKQGGVQVVKLYARICNTGNPNNPSCKSN